MKNQAVARRLADLRAGLRELKARLDALEADRKA
jgi:hypothetical protein